MKRMLVSLAVAIGTPSGLPPVVPRLVYMYEDHRVRLLIQRANWSRSIMWLLAKSYFDIKDHILSLFFEKNVTVGWNFALVWNPSSHSLDSVDLAIFTLFDLYTLNTMSVLLCLAECACIVERTSNVAHSSNVIELLGDLVLMMAVWWAQYLRLLIKHLTSGPVPIHLLSSAGSPVTPNAPPSALTTVFACSRAWSIIIN